MDFPPVFSEGPLEHTIAKTGPLSTEPHFCATDSASRFSGMTVATSLTSNNNSNSTNSVCAPDEGIPVNFTRHPKSASQQPQGPSVNPVHAIMGQCADEVTLKNVAGAIQSGLDYQVDWGLRILLLKSSSGEIFFRDVKIINKIILKIIK